jgi:hypothetical protein
MTQGRVLAAGQQRCMFRAKRGQRRVADEVYPSMNLVKAAVLKAPLDLVRRHTSLQ